MVMDGSLGEIKRMCYSILISFLWLIQEKVFEYQKKKSQLFRENYGRVGEMN